MKQTISFNFEKNFEAPEQEPLMGEGFIAFWAHIICNALEARLEACKIQLFDNRERVTEVSPDCIWYCTKRGTQKHYSIRAAAAMQHAIDTLKKGDSLPSDKMIWLQIAKSLYWVSPEERDLKIAGVTFDMLYSYILERVALP